MLTVHTSDLFFYIVITYEHWIIISFIARKTRGFTRLSISIFTVRTTSIHYQVSTVSPVYYENRNHTLSEYGPLLPAEERTLPKDRPYHKP